MGAPSSFRRLSVIARVAIAAIVGLSGLAVSARPVAALWDRMLKVFIYADGVNFGDGSGRVTSDDGLIDCHWPPDESGYGTCSANYLFPELLPSADVTLTFDPSDGSYVCLTSATTCYENG